MPLAETVFRSKIASYCEREMSTGLERHTNEDGAYPKAGGHTLRFVKYVGLKSLFSLAFFQQNLRWINDTSSSSTTIISQKKRAQLMPWTAWSSQDGSQLMLSVLRLLKCIERV